MQGPALPSAQTRLEAPQDPDQAEENQQNHHKGGKKFENGGEGEDRRRITHRGRRERLRRLGGDAPLTEQEEEKPEF